MIVLLAQGMAGDEAEWAGQTTLHPLGLGAVIVLGVAVVWVSRAWALLPFVLMACFVSSAQRLVVLGINFDLLRIMLVCGWVRVIMRHEHRDVAWRGIDTLMVVYAIVMTTAYTAQHGTPQALVNALGHSYDSVGFYLLFRCLAREWLDVDRLALGFVLVSLPVFLAFLIESRTGRNAFAVFGGVPAVTPIREGRLRCQGAFSHSILAGCFWAAVLPMIAAYWWRTGAQRLLVAAGVVASVGIVVMSASSTPILGVVAGVGAAAMFPLRHRLTWIRWAVAASLVGLHFVMKAPVWSLIARIDVVGGSTGWHRYHLVDEAIRHFGEWALIGTPSTAHWGYGLGDVTNQYVLEGVRGGFVTLALFILIMALAFRDVGRLCRLLDGQGASQVGAWALGASLFVHAMAFIAVSYFGQITMLWYLALAVPVSLADPLYARSQAIDAALESSPVGHERFWNAA